MGHTSNKWSSVESENLSLSADFSVRYQSASYTGSTGPGQAKSNRYPVDFEIDELNSISEPSTSSPGHIYTQEEAA